MIRIGMLGFGTVGRSVYDLLQAHTERFPDMQIVSVAVRQITEQRMTLYPTVQFTTNPDTIVTASDIDVVIEVMGGQTETYRYLRRALHSGKHVITANKDLIATYGETLQKIASAHQLALLYGASVAGGIPILDALTNLLPGDETMQVGGIINGTSNFILTQMSDAAMNYDDALALAQRMGIAEANPVNDVAGFDARYKLAILAKTAFDANVETTQIPTQGIQEINATVLDEAKRLGYVIKPLAVARRTGQELAMTVGPHLVPAAHLLGKIDNVQNAVQVKTRNIQDLVFTGPGAGAKPTASAVLSDLAIVHDIVCGRQLVHEKQALQQPVITGTAAGRYIRVTAPATYEIDAIAQANQIGIKTMWVRSHRATILTDTVSPATLARFEAALQQQIGAKIEIVLPVYQE